WLVAFTFIATGIFGLIIDWQFKKQLFAEIGSQALIVATSAAAHIDGDQHELIRSREDENSAAYRQIALALRRFRDANRRGDVFIKNVYTLRRSKTSPNQFEFVVDAEDNPDELSHVGDIVRGEGADPITERA